MQAKRNDPCPCGSGKKYKKCHGQIEAEKQQIMRSFSVGAVGSNPALTMASKIISALESNEQIAPRIDLPPSKASTKEAENPQLAPPNSI